MALKTKIKLGKMVAMDRRTGKILKEVKFPKTPVAQNPSGITYSPVPDLNDIGDEWKTTSELHPSDYELKLVPCEPNDPNILSWVKITLPSGTYLICDRPLFKGVFGGWGGKDHEYPEYPYFGVVHEVDGVEYTSVNLTSEEWTQLMENKMKDPTLPTPNSDDINSTTADDVAKKKYKGAHNQFWFWYGNRTCVYTPGTSGNQMAIGYNRPTELRDQQIGSSATSFCLRPILKITPYSVSISGDTKLGDKLSPFQYTYSIKVDFRDEPLDIGVYLDDTLLEEYHSEVNVVNKVLVIGEDLWNKLDYGTHHISIKANDVTKVISFKKVTNKPDALPPDQSLIEIFQTIIETSDYVDYLCAEATEKLQNIINNKIL